MSAPIRHRLRSTDRRVALVAVTLVAGLALGACGADDEAELAAPVRIEAESPGADAAAADAEMAGEDALSMIAPPWYAAYEFEIVGDLGPLPTDDTALHYPAGVTIDSATVARLARRLGVEGDPRPGADGIAWQVGPDDGSAPSLTVSSDALLSWSMSGPWTQWPPTGAPDAVFGNLQSAFGSLATPVPTGPYPLIGLEEAIARLERMNSSIGAYPEPVAVAPEEVTPLDDLESDVESLESDEDRVASSDDPVSSDDQPVVEPMPVEPMPVEVLVVELVAVEASTWTVWAEDGSLWVVPAYRFVAADGMTFDVPAVTDEFLAIDPWFSAIGEPTVDGSGTVDPMPAEIPIEDAGFVIGLDLDAATVAADERGWSVREARRDGEDLAVTADYVPTRINVAVEAGVITEVLSIG